MARRKTPSTSKITRDNSAPKLVQRGSSVDVAPEFAPTREPDAAPEMTAVAPREITRDEIAKRAYQKFLARGRGHGDQVRDWLEAEAELRASAR